MNGATPGSATHSRTGSSSGNTASLRPRNKRLLTGFEEFSKDFHQNASPAESPFITRDPSPLPSTHPSRSSSRKPSPRNSFLNGDSLNISNGNDLANSLTGLWGKSWTSLQGLANNVLGNDASTTMVKDKTLQRERRPLEATHSRNGKGSSIAWGPSKGDIGQPGAGTREERKAIVRAKKREELLDETSALSASAAARYKRRTSDDVDAVYTPLEDDNNRDALVYIHHVKPNDTLPGISIRYNCSLVSIKKANRLWSNDGIQVRKTLVIPVESCGVRGRRVTVPDAEEEDDEDLLCGTSNIDLDATPRLSSSTWTGDRRASSSTIRPVSLPSNCNYKFPTSPKLPSSPARSAKSNTAEDSPWTHDSWILFEGQTSAVEIGRIPRSDLGFFPRARKKSVSYSDLDTPSTSFDLPRPSITISDPTATAAMTTSNHRSRRSSSSNGFTRRMMGPGGVGSLAGKGVSAPGPAEDKLNKVIAKHLPGILPAAVPLYEEDDYGTLSGVASPSNRLSASSSVVGLENMGGAIEGWVRKMARSAAKAVEPATPQAQAARRTGLGVGLGPGDLIELNDAFELETDEEESEIVEGFDTERGRTRPPTAVLYEDEGWKKKGD